MDYLEILPHQDYQNPELDPVASAYTLLTPAIIPDVGLHRVTVSSLFEQEAHSGYFVYSSICPVFVYPYILTTFPAQPSEPFVPLTEAVSSTENPATAAAVCVCVFACCALDT